MGAVYPRGSGGDPSPIPPSSSHPKAPLGCPPPPPEKPLSEQVLFTADPRALGLYPWPFLYPGISQTFLSQGFTWLGSTCGERNPMSPIAGCGLVPRRRRMGPGARAGVGVKDGDDLELLSLDRAWVIPARGGGQWGDPLPTMVMVSFKSSLFSGNLPWKIPQLVRAGFSSKKKIPQNQKSKFKKEHPNNKKPPKPSPKKPCCFKKPYFSSPFALN